MPQRIDDILTHGSFKLDGLIHTVLKQDNGMAVCEREDGKVCYLAGHMETDKYGLKRRWLYQFVAPLLP